MSDFVFRIFPIRSWSCVLLTAWVGDGSDVDPAAVVAEVGAVAHRDADRKMIVLQVLHPDREAGAVVLHGGNVDEGDVAARRRGGSGVRTQPSEKGRQQAVGLTSWPMRRVVRPR